MSTRLPRKELDYMLMPVISFQGNCDEALTYYKEVFDAEVKTINYFRDAPPNIGMDESTPPNFVLYSEVSIFGVNMVMCDGGEKPPESFWLQLTFDSAEKVTSVFNKLADGGKVIEPLAPQFWASLNGNVDDRFGVHWNIITSS